MLHLGQSSFLSQIIINLKASLFFSLIVLREMEAGIGDVGNVLLHVSELLVFLTYLSNSLIKIFHVTVHWV